MASRIFCGTGEAANGRGTIRLDIDAPEGSLERVNLWIDHITRKMASNIPPRFFDLLDIAAYIYAADQLISRGGDKMIGVGRDWRRDLQFSIPVRDPVFWNSKETCEQLIRTLSFLSDDYYRFEFRPTPPTRSIEDYLDFDSDAGPIGFHPDRVVLFSGGLDSLSGAAHALLAGGEKLALVSHFASTKVQSRQVELVDALKQKGAAGRIFHVGIRVTRGQEEPRDFTQRTRSFLFASLACVVACLFRKDQITYFENGITSVNLPLAEHVLGSRATRTTHPKVLNDFGKLFSLIAEKSVAISNAYFWLTKTEVLHRLAEASAPDLVGRSFSCSHVRVVVRTGKHCGVCTQCLERRFAVLAAGLAEHDPVDGYQTDLLRGERTEPKGLTRAEAYVLAASRYAEMTSTAFAASYGGLARVLPYLEGDPSESSEKLFELHRRHGRSVRGVVDANLRALTFHERVSLPKTSLLSLISAPFGSPAPVREDPTERELSAPEQARLLPAPDLVRPVMLWFDHLAAVAHFTSGIRISGVGYTLIAVLADRRFEDHVARRAPEAFEFIKSDILATRLQLSDESLRQQVHRIRTELKAQFNKALDVELAQNEVIESHPWKGYRLAGDVVIRPRGEVPDANVTAPPHASQLSSDAPVDPPFEKV